MSADHDDRTDNFRSIKYHFVRSKCVFIKLQYHWRRFSENFVRSCVFLLDHMIGDRPCKWPWKSHKFHSPYLSSTVLSIHYLHLYQPLQQCNNYQSCTGSATCEVPKCRKVINLSFRRQSLEKLKSWLMNHIVQCNYKKHTTVCDKR